MFGVERGGGEVHCSNARRLGGWSGKGRLMEAAGPCWADGNGKIVDGSVYRSFIAAVMKHLVVQFHA